MQRAPRRHTPASLALALALYGCTARSEFMRPAPRVEAWIAPADRALVVFIRPDSFSAAVKATVLDDQGNYVGDSLPASYFSASVTPGDHVFLAWAMNTAVLEAHLAAGQTYFVEVVLSAGLWAPRVDLVPLTPRSEDWSRRGEWLHDYRSLAVDPAQGQAAFKKRKDDVEGQLKRARGVLKDYSSGELVRVSLQPGDGI